MNLKKITLISLQNASKIIISRLKEDEIYSIYDLLYSFPKKHEEYMISSIKDKYDATNVTFKGRILSKPVLQRHKNNLSSIKFNFETENEVFGVILFNRPYLVKQDLTFKEVVINGKYDFYKKNFTCSKIFIGNEFIPIIPQYKTKTIAPKTYQKLVKEAFDLYHQYLVDDIPKSLIDKYKLCNIKECIYNAHFPVNKESLVIYQRRLKYEELLKFSLKISYLHQLKEENIKKPKVYDVIQLREFIKRIPFELTDDQKLVTNEICKKLKNKTLMNLLVQADVGSGKTIVGFLGSFAAVLSGYQVAIMAPTEILAKQHYLSLLNLINDSCNIEFLANSLSKAKKENVLEKLRLGVCDIVIGTHSLFQDNVTFKKLGFVVIDEQHRFGVNQRVRLLDKGEEIDCLYLTATPIPRTLTKTIFKDMDILTIKTKPKGRMDVQTFVYHMDYLDDILFILDKEIKRDHQAYIVLPFIESEEHLDCHKIYGYIQKKFPHMKVSILTGKTPNHEKNEIMKKYIDQELDVIISTTVIEVGVDNPNATVMIVVNAERFGLSQLHQLRGRVGRKDIQSFCYLLTINEDIERLKILESTNDGFLLSEEDLKLRGPGDFFGMRQSGLPEFIYADFKQDYNILAIASKDSDNILKNLDSFENNYIRKYLEDFSKDSKID